MSNNNNFLPEYDQNELFISVDSIDYPFSKIPPEFTTEFVHLAKAVDDALQIQEKILSLRKQSSYINITDGGNSISYYLLLYRYSDNFLFYQMETCLFLGHQHLLLRFWIKI